MRPLVSALIVTTLSTLSLGCAFDPSSASAGSGGNTGAANSTGIYMGPGGGGTTGRGGNGGSTPLSNPDANCGAKDKPAAKLPPDILIVLDRSGSMNEDMTNDDCGGSCGATSKWALMTPALNQVVADTQNEVNWGLKFFADANNNSCSVNNSANVGIGSMKASAIMSQIAGQTASDGGVTNGSRTPTRAAMNGAVTYLKGLTSPNPKYILLATDGLPNCPASGSSGTADSAGAIAAVQAAAAAGYPTFVVGIATAGMADDTLSSMATAGGLARASSPAYYPVTTGADLAEAIRKLVTVASSCRFEIGAPPTTDGTTSLGRIDVYGDATRIPRDTTHTSGYDYTDATMKTIEVFGSTCDQVMAGTIQNVTVTFQCILG